MKLKQQLLTLGALGLLGSSAFAFTHVTANVTTSTTWTVANSPYILEGQIFVSGAGTILDIEPGVIIRGQPQSAAGAADAGSLIIRPEAKIQARGTAANPIIFTTAALDAGLVAGGAANGLAQGYSASTLATRWTPADGDTKYLDLNPASSPLVPVNSNGLKNTSFWGGLIIAGDSLTNSGKQVDVDGSGGPSAGDDGFGYIEGITAGPSAIYGGGNSEHDGGIVKYVSIRHGGAALSTGKELNALTLYAVGSKTTISYIDTYCSGDDGVEIFGGTVNLDHLNLIYSDDDGLDTDEGWQGMAQFVFVLQGYGYGDNGLELDGEDKLENDTSTFGSPAAANPIGHNRIYNATVLMNTQLSSVDPINSNATGASNAARMRAGWAGMIVNSIFQNCSPTVAGQGLRIDGLKTTGLGAGETAEYGNSAQTYFGTGLTQLRNNTVFGFSTLYTAVSGGSVTQSNTGVASGTYNGVAIPSVYYPATLNRTLSTSIAIPNHTTPNGVNPRPSLAASSLAYGTTQDSAYVVAPAIATDYKGAFDRNATTLWTFGWTALSKRGILAP